MLNVINKRTQHAFRSYKTPTKVELMYLLLNCNKKAETNASKNYKYTKLLQMAYLKTNMQQIKYLYCF